MVAPLPLLPVFIAMNPVTIHLTDVAVAMQPQIPRHRDQSEAIRSAAEKVWIA
jgi:hypothetical protein